MSAPLDELTAPADATIADTMRLIDANREGIALIVDDAGVLVGTATDGDIRRGILRGLTLDSPVSEVMNTSPRTAPADSTPDQIEPMFEGGSIRLVPLVDARGVVVEVRSFKRSAPAAAAIPAVLMAGGLGTRLRPLTEDTPKPMLPIGGKPIMEITLERLRDAGIEEVVVTTRYLAEKIEEHFDDGSQWDMGISYVREEERRGTAGALRTLAGTLEGPFLVMNADLLTEIDVAKLLAFHQDQSAALTVAVRQYTFKVPYGVAQVDGTRITALVEKPSYDFFVNAGIYILEPWVVDLIPPDQYFDITELIDLLLEQGHVVASFPFFEQWIDIGRPEDLERAHAILSKGE